MPECTIEEVKAKLDRGEKFYLLDVWEDSEWVKLRIPGARHLGGGVIARDIEAEIPNPNAEIILYCVGGYRSLLSADLIRRLGYTNVKSMAGGIRAWREAGYPIDDKELPLPQPCYP
ncbi:MAG: sulfurtransferase [Nitrospirae bacterium]|nr:MAG: sulfurtransferase [Nitrospirota bacterium]